MFQVLSWKTRNWALGLIRNTNPNQTPDICSIWINHLHFPQFYVLFLSGFYSDMWSLIFITMPKRRCLFQMQIVTEALLYVTVLTCVLLSRSIFILSLSFFLWGSHLLLLKICRCSQLGEFLSVREILKWWLRIFEVEISTCCLDEDHLDFYNLKIAQIWKTSWKFMQTLFLLIFLP